MNLIQHYWLAIKTGEDFSKFSEEQLPQVWLFNYIGIIFNFSLFFYFDIILKYVFLIVGLFYLYRWFCFRRYSIIEGLDYSLSKKKRPQH